MDDRRWIPAVAGAVLVATVAVLFATVPLVPEGGARETPVGRVIQLAALGFGLVGALSGTAQIRTMLRTRSADDVSRGFLLMLTGSFAAWLSYGIVLGDWVMLVVNTTGITITLTTLLFAVRLQRRGAPGPEDLAREGVLPR